MSNQLTQRCHFLPNTRGLSVQGGKTHVGWLCFIVLSIVLLSLIFYVFQLSSATGNNKRAAKIFEQSLLASINQFEYLPSLVARDDLVLELLTTAETDHKKLSDKLAFIVARSGADDLFLQDVDGKVVATSNYQREGHNFYGKNYAFRPYFRQAKSERKRQFYFAKGATTGIPGFFISEPVIDRNTVLGVVVVKLELSDWEENWRQSKDDVLVADENGIVILSSNNDWKYKSLGDVSAQTLQSIYSNKQFPDEQHEALISRQHSLSLLGGENSAYWTIADNAYLVNSFNIRGTNWNLFHIENHRNIIAAAFLFFIIMSALGLFLVLLQHERAHKQELRAAARKVEQQRRQQLQMLIDNIHIGVLVFDDTGGIMSMNQHAQFLLLSGQKFVAHDDIAVSQLIDLDVAADDFDSYLLEDIETPAYHETVTLEHIKANAEPLLDNSLFPAVPIMFSVGKIQSDGKEAYLMSVINITRRKQVEDELLQVNESLEETVYARTTELRNTQSELIQKNKAVALGNMAATIVHELSQPLAAINSSVAAIQNKVEQDNWSGARESLSRLMPLSSKMNNVIKLLKYFSYEDDALVEEVCLSVVVRQAVEILQDRLTEQSIQVEFDDQCPTALVKVSPIKIDLAVSNLLKNAIEALESVPNAGITIALQQSHSHVSLNIKDNAGGVDERIMGQLFNPYFTTKEVGKGMGLGLSITYEIVQQYGGIIAAKNIANGACFTIELPLSSGTAKPTTATLNDRARQQKGDKKSSSEAVANGVDDAVLTARKGNDQIHRAQFQNNAPRNNAPRNNAPRNKLSQNQQLNNAITAKARVKNHSRNGEQ